MADQVQYAIIDRNDKAALMGHLGTANTDNIVRLVATNDGALKVDIVSGDEIIVSIGTIELQQFSVRVDDQNTGTAYIGEAVTGSSEGSAVWRIKEVVDTGGTQEAIKFADGDLSFNNIWSARGTMSFS